MKLLTQLALLSVALALPTNPDKRELQSSASAAGIGAGGSTCLVFARGSTEPSPIGLLIGPGLVASLKYKIPDLQVFPVYYAASLGTNISPLRTDSDSIKLGVAAFQKAHDAGCDVIIAGGYSQGAAVMHNVIATRLGRVVKGKVAGVALFGDTRNYQDGKHIPNFPRDKSRVWCNDNDGVCNGGLNVNIGHLSYGPGTISEATTWLMERIAAQKGSRQ